MFHVLCSHDLMMFDERLVLNNESKANIIYDEHLVRYQLAAQVAKGKRVLDIACGSGYGAKILAQAGAAQVIAVDIDAKAIEAAKKNYGQDNIEFKTGDAESIKEADNLFDLIISFETIEHLPDAEKYLSELARVLKKEGMALISTPNREVFGQKNPYHLREFIKAEFEEILRKYFKNIFILDQINGLASLIKSGNSGKVYFSESTAPSYYIAAVSNNDLQPSDLFQESVVSINPAALDRIKNNPVLKFVDKIYSLIKK
jgi:2-polyprenyl-3-methyl-5-hydroxy-6-metoxy-1,4-benzoquinol methylase